MTGVAITLLIRYPEGRRLEQCQIHYHDIGDYLTRAEKLSHIREASSIASLPWTSITPNAKHDWLNQRDGLFDTLIPLTIDSKYNSSKHSVFTGHSRGFETGRDSWVYNFSREELGRNIQSMIAFYNEQLGKAEPSMDETKISWTSGLLEDAKRGKPYTYTPSNIITGLYRPFCKQNLYSQRAFVHRPAIQERFFPIPELTNLVICISGTGGNKKFSALIVKQLPDLELLEKSQCFPLYWYEERKDTASHNLFGEENSDRWVRHDGISDWMLGEVQRRFAGTNAIDKEDIFYYVYGLLHSPDYRERFADDLRKSLPRIPIVERVEDFIALIKAGRALAELHLGYETHAHQAGVEVEELESKATDEYAYYAVEKMRFPKKGERGTIVYNGYITITNIPLEAYDYVVNGKSAIEWIMDRYAVTTDKRSGITNDPNLWSREHGKPRYILDLLLSVIYLSVETQRIVRSLPTLHFPS